MVILKTGNNPIGQFLHYERMFGESFVTSTTFSHLIIIIFFSDLGPLTASDTFEKKKKKKKNTSLLDFFVTHIVCIVTTSRSAWTVFISSHDKVFEIFSEFSSSKNIHEEIDTGIQTFQKL